MDKNKHHSRHAQLPKGFMDYLRRYLPGFKHEPAKIRMAVVRMIWSAPSKYRQHNEFPGWATFHYEWLAKKFGAGKFGEVNKRLGLFIIKEDDLGREGWSKVEGRTKAYMLTDRVSDLRSRFLANITRRSTELLTDDGDVRRTLPDNALNSKGQDGQTRMGWRGQKVRTDVPVDQPTMRDMLKHIKRVQDLQEVANQQNLFHPPADPEYLRSLDEELRVVFYLSTDKHAPGTLAHRYTESPSGRLYAEGINLQNSSKLVRQAAMHGCYDYDIENCHYDILYQMAQRVGVQCGHVQHYLDNKSKVRQQLADELHIPARDIKQALISLVYGASMSDDPKRRLPKLLGMEKALALYEQPLFKGLAEDVAAARSAILKAHPPVRQKLANIVGLRIDVRRTSELQQLAHLIQGVESKALEAACRSAETQFPGCVVLLQHDGFTATKKLDTGLIEQAILGATGFALKVPGGTYVAPRPEEALADHPAKYQNDFQGKPSIHAGLRPISPPSS